MMCVGVCLCLVPCCTWEKRNNIVRGQFTSEVFVVIHVVPLMFRIVGLSNWSVACLDCTSLDSQFWTT